MKDLASFHRVHMAQLPTPIEPLYRLSLKLKGPTIWIKRDDRTGLAGGGNKARKLEYLVAEALKQKSDLLITAGGAQSNHCRQTAAAAVRNRLGCDLVLGGSPPAIANGNLLLDELLGAELHWTAPENRSQAMEELAEKRRRQGRRPYVIPIGGSNRLGALAYAVAMQETLNQLSQMDVDPDAIVFATSSGGTQAGLAVGARIFGYYGRLLGISIDRADSGPLPFRSELAALANDLASLLQLQETFQPQDFEINTDYLGASASIERIPVRSRFAANWPRWPTIWPRCCSCKKPFNRRISKSILTISARGTAAWASRNAMRSACWPAKRR